MADKMTDEAMFVAIEKALWELDGTTYRNLLEARAHIAARLGGGEAPVAWVDPCELEDAKKYGGMIVATSEQEPESRRTCPLYYTPPARLAATAVGGDGGAA